MDPIEAKKQTLDEIMEYAKGKMAEGLKSRHAPPPPPEPIPGVEPEEGEAPVEEGVPSLEDLSALLGE